MERIEAEFYPVGPFGVKFDPKNWAWIGRERPDMKLVGIVGLVLTMAFQAVAEPVTQADRLVFQDLYGREAIMSPDDAAPASVLFFFSNTCPVARRYVPRMIQLAVAYRARGVQFVAINVSQDDTLDDVAHFAMEYGFTFPVVKDPGFAAVKALGVSRTPEVTVLDKNFAATYQGRIDDQYRLGGVRPEATRHDLADALDALLEGRPVPASHVPAEGCVVTVPADGIALPGPVSEPDRASYNMELAARDGGGADRPSGTHTWVLDPARTNVGWMTALRVDGGFKTGAMYYFAEGNEARHYLAGALRPGQPLRWNEDEAIQVPIGTLLYLDTTGETLQAPVVRMDINDSPPAWTITCTASVIDHMEGDGMSPTILLQPLPPHGQPRAISMHIGHYGTALSVDFIPDEGLPMDLLSLPALDPRVPGPYTWVEPFPAQGGRGSLRVTLERPGYLSWPSRGAEVSEPTITLYTYWAART